VLMELELRVWASARFGVLSGRYCVVGIFDA
jgi:hypothetical protein